MTATGEPLRVVCERAVSAAMAEAGFPAPEFQLDDYECPDEATLLCFVPLEFSGEGTGGYGLALAKAVRLVAERFGWPGG